MKSTFTPFLFSALIHTIVLLASIFISDIIRSQPPISGGTLQFEVINNDPFKESLNDDKEAKKEEEKEEVKENKVPSEANSFNDRIKSADTSSLSQIYSESTLNVKIKYPIGWTFIDQNVKSRLDGVTFFGATDGTNPPPYIHLEVQEKYLFNPSRFREKTEMRNAELYFNKPEELEGQVTQVVYIRTKEDYDYQIKLIVNGRERFNQYLPVFFSMIKTFQFGYGWFN